MILFEKLFELRFVKFCIVGVLSTLTHSVVFVLLIEQAGIEPVIASIPAFSLAVIVSYVNNYNWTFQSKGNHSSQLPKFILVATIGLLANVLITYMIVNVLGSGYWLALLAVILIVPLITYQLNHLWVFGKKTVQRFKHID